MSNAIVVMLMLAGSPAFAEQPVPAPSTRSFGALRPSHSPYKELFEPRQSVQPIEAPVAKPKVVCGMTIIPADPAIDPKMAIAPKRDSNLKYTIRAIEPPICRIPR